MSRFDALVLSCEHGGNAVPAAYRRLFRGEAPTLATHRGYDLGALEVARSLAKKLHAPLFKSETTRLLIDLNRSLGRPGLWSEFSGGLSEAERQVVIDRYYAPYRAAVTDKVWKLLGKGKRVLHFSVHSFTPMLRGSVRNADWALLYDPRRKPEAALALEIYAKLKAGAEDLRLRRNYPYVGVSDGFTTSLRKRFPASSYAGMEIEMNQALSALASERPRLVRVLASALGEVLG